MSHPVRLERARWLAGAGLIVPIPLLFAVGANPALVASTLVVIALLALLLTRGRLFVLPDFVLNLLGVAFLFALFGDRRLVAPSLTGLSIHLLLFLFAVRLLSLRGRREEWTAFLLLVLLAMAGAATAVDVTIMVWLLAISLLLLHMLSRFVHLGELEEAGGRVRGGEGPVPPLRLTALLLLGAILLAIPIFVLLPRMRQPFVRGFSSDARSEGAFSDRLDMASIGRLKNGTSIVFRASWPNRSIAPGEGPKFRVGVYETYESGAWSVAGTAAKGAPGAWVAAGLIGEPLPFEPREAELDGRFEPVEVDLARTGGASLPVPYRMVAFEAPSTLAAVWRDRAGILQTRFPPSRPLTYRLWVAKGEIEEPFFPPGRAKAELGLPEGGLERVRALAASLDPGDGKLSRLGSAIERHLAMNLGYTLMVIPPPEGVDPIEHFVSTSRQGHCELFASAMALMLRSRGVPARVVVGFAGGETSLFGGEIVYRQRHAHAWVEAWDANTRIWLVFDPTPAEGRPTIERPSIIGQLRSAWEWIQFSWDRFVLGFDFGDQFGLFRRARFALHSWSRRLESVRGEGLEAIWKGLLARARGLDPVAMVLIVGALALVVPLVRLLVRLARDRRRPPGRRAFERAIARLVAVGLVPEEAAARTGKELGEELDPPVGGAFLQIVGFYEREAFGGERLDPEARNSLREALREVRRSAVAVPRALGRKEDQ